MKRIKDLIRILSIKKDKEVVTSSILTSPKVELSDGASDLSSVTSVIPSSNLSHLEHRPLFISKSKRFGTKEQQDLGTTLTVIILVFVIPIVGWFIEVELLIAAVSAGIALNYNERHPVMDMIEGYDYITNIVLFTFMGHRIILLSYMSSMWLALIFFTVRIFSLWIGSFVGGKLAHLPSRAPDHQWHHQYRWMALITQLAIALSLVDRMEEEFPESAPIARAYGGAVLLAIVIGPPALQTVLRIVGEDNGHKQKVQQVTRMSPTN